MVTRGDDGVATDRVVIVTGGSRGVGREITRALARRGYPVVISYARDQPTADGAVEEVLAARGSALAIRADVADQLDVERLFAETREAFGGVDVVVHAAGPLDGPGAFVVNREAVRRLRDGGSIVNLGCATSALAPRVSAAHAAACAAAVEAITHDLAAELRSRDITINAVVPGPLGAVPAAAVAELVACLVSSDARHLSGQVIRKRPPPARRVSPEREPDRRSNPLEVGMSTTDGDSDTAPAARQEPHSGWAGLRKILVATDGSPWSADAVVLAAQMAAKHRSELTFVHVVPAVDVVPACAVDGLGAAVRHRPTEHDHALLADAAGVAAEHGVTATTALLGGSTVEEIVAYGDSSGVDVIIVGSRGHGAVASLLGSVALGVLRASSRPVLIVRGGTLPYPAVDVDAEVERST